MLDSNIAMGESTKISQVAALGTPLLVAHIEAHPEDLLISSKHTDGTPTLCRGRRASEKTREPESRLFFFLPLVLVRTLL
jgi:hypothetical protein